MNEKNQTTLFNQYLKLYPILDSDVLRMYNWNFIMWLEVCCGPSDLQSEGAVLIEEFLSLTSIAIVQASGTISLCDAYILNTSSGKHHAFLRDFLKSIGVVSKSSEMICNLITTVSDWQTRRIMMMTTATLGTDTDTHTHTLTVLVAIQTRA